MTEGVVTTGTGGIWMVHTDAGEMLEASLRGRLKREVEGALKLAVGDRVVVQPGERGDGWRIAEILPRRSRLARRAPGGAHGERVIAAAKPEPHPAMLDRFLVIAEGNDLPARVVVNKSDLLPGERDSRFEDYVKAGYPVHLTSVKAARGLDELHAALAGRTSVLTGPSGVGKSSLLNALYPGLSLRVGEISESVNKGRHTTVGGYLHPLPDGGYVVDTPGLREVGMWDLPMQTLDSCFPEFRPFLGSCRFGDCTHLVEPDCAVRGAVKRGEISAARYDSYGKLRAELEEQAPKW